MRVGRLSCRAAAAESETSNGRVCPLVYLICGIMVYRKPDGMHFRRDYLLGF